MCYRTSLVCRDLSYHKDQLKLIIGGDVAGHQFQPLGYYLFERVNTLLQVEWRGKIGYLLLPFPTKTHISI